MTTIGVWLSVGKGRALVLASDSRYSWDAGTTGHWDRGRKIFRTTSFPDVFAFSGDALFCPTIIANVVGVFDRARNDVSLASFEQRADFFFRAIQSASTSYPRLNNHSSSFLHISVDDGKFCFVITRNTSRGWVAEHVGIDQDTQASTFIGAFGSGERYLRGHMEYFNKQSGDFYAWQAWQSLIAVCREDSPDKQTGGPVQATIIHQNASINDVGQYIEPHFYFFGSEIENPLSYETIEWRDEAYNWIHPKDGLPRGKRKFSVAF